MSDEPQMDPDKASEVIRNFMVSFVATFGPPGVSTEQATELFGQALHQEQHLVPVWASLLDPDQRSDKPIVGLEIRLPGEEPAAFYCPKDVQEIMNSNVEPEARVATLITLLAAVGLLQSAPLRAILGAHKIQFRWIEARKKSPVVVTA